MTRFENNVYSLTPHMSQQISVVNITDGQIQNIQLSHICQNFIIKLIFHHFPFQLQKHRNLKLDTIKINYCLTSFASNQTFLYFLV